MAESLGTPTSSPRPIKPQNRLDFIDIIRGFAVFGILVANMLAFSGITTTLTSVVDPIDRAVLMFTQFFVRAKFYSLFSFLFGWGMAMQMARMDERGLRFTPIYLRRMLVLLLIGLLHGTLLWSGDILTLYALLGFLLLTFRRRSDKFVILAIVISLLVPIVMNLPGEDGESIRRWYAGVTDFLRFGEYTQGLYSVGSYADITRWRVSQFVGAFANILYYVGNVFAMFLLGLFVGRKGLFRNLDQNRPLLWITLLGGGILGVVLNGVFLWLGVHPDSIASEYYRLVYVGSRTIGAPALMLFYVAAIVLLAQNDTWRSRMMPLANVGRMALSNYLFQSVVATLIFYSYGLGLYGEVSPGFGLALTVLIFIIQIRMSNWWFRRYRYGLLEWFWRSLTYGHIQPLSVYKRPSEIELPNYIGRIRDWASKIPPYIRLSVVWLALMLWGVGLIVWSHHLRTQVEGFPLRSQEDVISTFLEIDTEDQPDTSVEEDRASSSGQFELLYSGGYHPSAIAASGDPVAMANMFDIGSAMGYVEKLTGPRYFGRAAGSLEGRAAGDYLADHFEKLGLAPAGDNGTYFQEFNVNYTPLAEKPILRVEDSQDVVHENYLLNRDYSAIIRWYLGSGEGNGPVYWLEDCAEDKFIGLDLVGNVVLCRSDEGRLSLEITGRLALEHGAVGLLVMTDPAMRPMDFSIPYHPTWIKKTLPGLWVPPAVVKDLLIGSGESIFELLTSEPHELSGQVFIKVQAETGESCPGSTCKGRNVLAVLPGRDQEFSQELVILGAHYDHMGQSPDGTVWAGANDNASGVAVLLEIARSWHEQGFVPRRSVLFAAWDGEELGLLGSRRYVENPTFPLGKTLAMLQLDMVGAGAENLLIGNNDELGSQLKAVADELDVLAEISDVGGSDHVPFEKVGVPASLLTWEFPEGEASTYHQPSDVSANLDPKKLGVAGKIANVAAINIAEVEPNIIEMLERRAEAIEQGDLDGFLQSSSSEQHTTDIYWFQDVQKFQPSNVTLEMRDLLVKGSQASSQVGINIAYLETNSQPITRTLSTSMKVKFINNVGHWQWAGPDLVRDGDQTEEDDLFTISYPEYMEDEVIGLEDSAQERYTQISNLLELPEEKGAEILVFPDTNTLQASTALSLPKDQRLWVEPELIKLTYREGITQSMILDRAIGQLVLANHGISESTAAWLWNGLTLAWHGHLDPAGFQESYLPKLHKALTSDDNVSDETLAWAAVEYFIGETGWAGLGNFISRLEAQCSQGHCRDDSGQDIALQETLGVGVSSKVFEERWKESWSNRLTRIQVQLDENLRVRKDAILSGDEQMFLATLNTADSNFLEAERHWFESVSETPVTAVDFQAKPILLRDDGSVVANVALEYLLENKTESQVIDLRINFVPNNGKLLWSGPDFAVISGNHVDIYHTNSLADMAEVVLDESERVYPKLASMLSVDQPQRLSVRLYEDSSAYRNSIALTFSDENWLQAWSAPGEGVKLLVNRESGYSFYHSFLINAMVRNLLLQKNIDYEWFLKGGEVYWSKYFDGGETTQSAASHLSALVENLEHGFVFDLESMPGNLDLSYEEYLIARTQAWDSLRFFVESYGSQSLTRVLDELSQGNDLETAFQHETRRSLDDFQDTWKNSIRNGHIDDTWVNVARSFDQDNAIHHVEALTRESLSGRAAGTIGAELAAQYIVDKFSEYGLLPAGDISGTTFSQTFPISATHYSYPPRLEILAEGGVPNLHFFYRDDFIPISVLTDTVGLVQGELVWGNGELIPREEVKGNILLLNPGENILAEIEQAAELEAEGLILIGNKRDEENVLTKNLGRNSGLIPSSLPVFELTQNGVNKLRTFIEDFKEAEFQMSESENLGVNVRIGPGLLLTERVETANILGLLPGSDPDLRDEILVLGAHYDHVGDDPNTRICGSGMGCEIIPGRKYSGANDDASGVGVLLEVARLWHQNDYRPRRTILFAAWGAQEYGELGSQYYLSNPTVPLESIMGIIQLDGVGGGEGFNLGAQGVWESEGDILFALLNASNHLGEDLLLTEKFDQSDHISFQEKGAPNVLMAWRLARDVNLPDGIANAVHADRLGVTGRIVSLTAMTLAR